MTNQPDESHPMRDRVDEAISWFTHTDEVPPPAATPVTVEHTPLPEERTSVVGERTSSVEERTSAVEERTSAVEESRSHVGESTSHVGESIRGDVGTPTTEPAANVTPARGVEDQSLNTPVAANLPGNEAAPVDLHPEPVAEPVESMAASREGSVAEPYVHPTDVAPERVYEADEFSAHPVEAVPVHAEAEPTEVAPERLSQADAFAPTPAAATGVAEPLTNQVESSAVEEPTRIHPIEPPSSWAEVHPEAKGLTADEANAGVETTAAQRSLFRDEAPTVALPAGAFAAGAAVPLMEQTSVMDAQEAARVRREERAARDRQLGKVISAPDDSDEPMVTKFRTPSTYKGLPSLGLLLFRLVIAAVVGIRAWQHITHLTATRDMWAATIVPSPGVITWTQIGLEIAIAVMLVLGLGTRIAGGLLLVLSLALLVLVQWGVVSPFQPGAADFIGVVDLLLAGAGILFATIGGGRLAFDGTFHTSRIRRKNDRLFA